MPVSHVKRQSLFSPPGLHYGRPHVDEMMLMCPTVVHHSSHCMESRVHTSSSRRTSERRCLEGLAWQNLLLLSWYLNFNLNNLSFANTQWRWKDLSTFFPACVLETDETFQWQGLVVLPAYLSYNQMLCRILIYF